MALVGEQLEEQGIRLKPVNDLLGEKFFIPAYQRGYRWGRQQVLDLLEDISGFQSPENDQPSGFYCLQPLVLKSLKAEQWEVVDGQQRLTTLFLILQYFNLRMTEEFRKNLYDVEFETRPGSACLLYTSDAADE